MWIRGNTKGFYNKFMSYLDSTFSDHGLFRLVWRSWEELPGQMYRSNQPYPYQIKNDIQDYKIKSIINLRGERHCSSFYLENDFCKKNKIKIYNFPISSRDIPDKDKLLGFNELLNKIDYPCLMHCKSGADRAGLAAALYLIFKKNYSLSKAVKQLTIKHLHIKYAKTGILDYFFSQLIKKGISNKSDLIKWLNKDYDKQALKKSFKVNSILDALINFIFKRE
ncbi:MAG: protein tyrosine phosphatase [Rickettsiales bacterium]|nr:protein tyrosine phosphatase [Rickettsiales bacterium]OUV79615.1 MAG: hypothetical protein CBC91_03490 [Rickettsiales bacterium TMED131]|tara:strand:+ start:116 stop:784 length:669 start_codon:yes stop_codon:yes gene_type:complete